MIQKKLAYTLFLLLNVSLLSADPFRVFKDSSGREMTAKLTRVSGDDVYIERTDGLSTKVAISIFSKDDQKYIRKWSKTNLLTGDIFDVRFTTEESSKQKTESGGIKRVQYKTAYKIEATNTSNEKIEDIRVEYLVVKFEDAIAAQKRSEGKRLQFKGNKNIRSIGPHKTASIITELVPMLETKLDPDYEWANGGKTTSKDKLDGIWVKMYVGDLLVHESSRPETLMRKTTWK